MPNHGDWQLGIYLDGLTGGRPELPMSYADLEARAEAMMPEDIWSYVAGGAGT
ncbi:lactate 2-monooxygenase, partial [Salmonella enterica subsp. enterica serovar Enteritidis]|nr:lactate 2-monooxygenase [Salmonella enterica subsp. enterica serovar Enteritidis]